MNNSNSSNKIYKAQTIGSFFLLVFLAYGFGQHLFKSDTYFEKYIGSLLIIANSIMVLFIGILFRKTIGKFNLFVGNIYLFSRIFESIALASIVLNLFPTIHFKFDFVYFSAMLILGLGSIPMCLTLYKYKISPSWLALWGVIGYSFFAFGFLMEFLGKEWSMYFLIIAGLWEITFGIWLIVKGRKIEEHKTTNS